MSLLDTFLEEGLTDPPPHGGPNSSRRDVFIAIRTDGAVGAGTPDNPYNGSTHELLDALLRNDLLITGNMTIRFGPGIFETKGNGIRMLVEGWPVRTGQRFIGSGMHQTTLRLVKARAGVEGKDAKVAVFYAGGTVSGVEISDMTIDCNLARQPKATNGEPALIYCPAIDLENAANTLIRRVRVINWGTHTPLYVNGVQQEGEKTGECFPIGINPPYRPAYGGNNVVEDCIIEQPDLHPARESTLINAKAIPMATIRNCYLNGDFTTGSPQPALQVLRIECADNVVTLQTRWPHNMQQGDSLWLAGSPAASFNDRFKLDLDPLDFRTLRFTKTPVGGEPDPNGSSVTVERYVPPAMLVQSLSADVNGLVTLVTKAPHRRRPPKNASENIYIRVAGALVEDSAGNPSVDNPYNGSFSAAPDASDPTKLTYQLDEADQANWPTAPASGEIWLDRWPSDFVVVTGVRNGSQGATHWEATYVMGPTSEWPALKRTPHYKVPGDYVLIQGIKDGAENIYNAWNGWFEVLAHTDTTRTTLRCRLALANEPASPAASFAVASLANPFQGLSAAKEWDENATNPPQSAIDGGVGPIVVGNRVIGLTTAGPYHDTGKVPEIITWDVVIRVHVVALVRSRTAGLISRSGDEIVLFAAP